MAAKVADTFKSSEFRLQAAAARTYSDFLKRLELAQKTRYENGRFRTIGDICKVKSNSTYQKDYTYLVEILKPEYKPWFVRELSSNDIPCRDFDLVCTPVSFFILSYTFALNSLV